MYLSNRADHSIRTFKCGDATIKSQDTMNLLRMPSLAWPSHKEVIYKLLGVAVCDWKNQISREKLDEIGRARPSVWGKYATPSITIKMLCNKIPVRLHKHIINTMYTTRRNHGVQLLFDDSKRKIGKQAIRNRL